MKFFQQVVPRLLKKGAGFFVALLLAIPSLQAKESNVREYLLPQYTVEIFTESTDLALSAIAAIRIWTSVAGYEGFIVSKEEGQSAEIFITDMWLPDGILGVTQRNGEGCFIGIAPAALGNIGTLVHELGHCFGFSHNEDDAESIMYPYYLDGQVLNGEMRAITQQLLENYFTRLAPLPLP